MHDIGHPSTIRLPSDWMVYGWTHDPSQGLKCDFSERIRLIGSGSRYAFAAESTESPAGSCPAYEAPDAVAAAVLAKQRQDDFATTQLIIRGTATVPVTTGLDGGTESELPGCCEIRKRAGAVIHIPRLRSQVAEATVARA